MADSTQLGTLNIFYWGTPSAPNPTLTSPLEDSATATTVNFSSAPLDDTGAVVTGDFLFGVRNSAGFTEVCYVPAGGMSVDGLTATGVIRAINTGADSLDYTATGGADYRAEHEQGSTVYCAVSSTDQNILRGAVQGTIATGGTGLIVGDETDTDVTISAALSSTVGFLKKNATTGKAQYSNDGAAWVNIDSVSASNLVEVSAADTTPGYLDTKVTVTSGTGATVTKSITSPAGDERLNIDVALDATAAGVTTHIIYTPAYMTGGSSAESNFAIWDSVTDGSFRVTLDGTGTNVDGIDFTGDASMADVAATIQAALRVVTSSTETVIWDTDHFLMTSADTTASSEMSVLTTSTGTVGTDISGIATVYMDSETGRGTATAAVVDPTADTGKVPLLNANGNVDPDLLNESVNKEDFTAKGSIMGATAANTPAELAVGNDGQLLTVDSSESTGLAYTDPIYMGPGSSDSVDWYSTTLPWLSTTDITLWTYNSMASAAYNYTWAYLQGASTNSYAATTTGLGLFPRWNGSTDTLRFADSFTTIVCEAAMSIETSTSLGNGLSFGFADSVNVWNDYDETTDDATTFGVDSSLNLYAHTCSGGGASTDTAIAGITVSDRNVYRIEYDQGSEARFYVNGTLEATITTTLPTASSVIRWGTGVTENGAGDTKVIVEQVRLALKI